jgi:DNA adenine methylase
MPEPLDFSKLVDDFDQLEDKSREEYKRAPFGWPGGKSRSLKEILPRLRQSKMYVETCGGSGVVLINRNQSPLEVFNDRHAGITAFFRCVQNRDKNRELIDRLKFMVHSREEFIWSRDTWENPTDDVERAARWYYMVRTSFGQLGRNWARATSGTSMIGPKFRRGLNGIPHLWHRFKDVQVENMDAVQCIKDYDSYETTFYVDPDYIGANPCYQHTVDHQRLLTQIMDSKGFFAVSNYKNPLYDSFDWDEVYTWEAFISMQSQAFLDSNHLQDKKFAMDRSQRATEVLYIREAK